MLIRRLTLLRKAIRPLGAALLDLVYPPLCLGCGAPVGDAQAPLCHRCLHSIEQVPPAEADELVLSRSTATSIDGVFCLWQYDKGGRLQHVHHALKYGNRPRYGVLLGKQLGAAYQDAAEHPTCLDLIVPVPLHRARLYERGYNQSTELARGVAQALTIPLCEHALKRTRATRSQTSLSEQARRDNVSGAFAASTPDLFADRKLLLVDDVVTTGATALSAAQTLKENGAAAVYLATLALARF